MSEQAGRAWPPSFAVDPPRSGPPGWSGSPAAEQRWLAGPPSAPRLRHKRLFSPAPALGCSGARPNGLKAVAILGRAGNRQPAEQAGSPNPRRAGPRAERPQAYGGGGRIVVVAEHVLHLSETPCGLSLLLDDDGRRELGGIAHALGVDAQPVKGLVVGCGT